MSYKKEFYYVRHGKTDYNQSNVKIDHEDISLNKIGKNQAQIIAPLISSLPIRSICCSPLKRAKETNEIISLNLQAKHYEIPELGECTSEIWKDMTSIDKKSNTSYSHVDFFLQRTLKGIDQVLVLEGPSLIVSHAGVHWAFCSLMQITDHEWMIDHCLPIHFFLGDDNRWKAKKLQ